MAQNRNAYRVWVRKPAENSLLGRTTNGRNVNNKLSYKQRIKKKKRTGYRLVVGPAKPSKNRVFRYKVRDISTLYPTSSFPNGTLLHRRGHLTIHRPSSR